MKQDVHQQSRLMRIQSRLVHLRQVHPLEGSICENLCNPWENIQQKGSVYSANSVGEYTARRVQSVGEHTARRNNH